LSFGVAQIMEAGMQAQRDPANLTDRQLEIIAAYAYADAQDFARQRAEARAKAAAPPPVAPSRPAAAPRRSGLTEADFARLGRVLAPRLRDYVTKRLAEAEPNAELEAVLARLNGLIVLHEGRITALESSNTPGPRWAGEHEPGKAYVAGELVRRKGDVWLCVNDSSAAPGMALGDWELFVRGGQARP
jgi:hypothetical protein